MVLRLYFDVMSQPSRAVLLFIRANSIPCQEIQVALCKGEHLKDEFSTINPFKKVPIIDHHGFKLPESVAIFKYLCRNYPTIPEHWYPKDNHLMARVDEYMAWQHLTLRLNAGMFLRTKILIPKRTGQPINEKAVARFQSGLENVLEQMETIWLKENKYIAGNDLTIADLLAVTELEQPGMGGFDVNKRRPILTTYMDLVRSRLHPHYDEVHSFVHKLRLKAMEKGSIN